MLHWAGMYPNYYDKTICLLSLSLSLSLSFSYSLSLSPTYNQRYILLPFYTSNALCTYLAFIVSESVFLCETGRDMYMYL